MAVGKSSLRHSIIGKFLSKGKKPQVSYCILWSIDPTRISDFNYDGCCMYVSLIAAHTRFFARFARTAIPKLFVKDKTLFLSRGWLRGLRITNYGRMLNCMFHIKKIFHFHVSQN